MLQSCALTVRLPGFFVLALFPLLLGALPARADSLTLNQAVQRAMQVDPALASARVAEDNSQLNLLRSNLDRVQFSVDSSVTLLFNKYGIGLPPELQQDVPPGQGLFSVNANLNVPVFSGLRVESVVARNEKLADSRIQAVQVSRKDLALSVARAYWSVRRNAMLTEAQERSLKRLEESEQVVSNRVKAGLAPPIDLNRAKLRRLQQMSTLAELNGQTRQASEQLAVALGISTSVEAVDDPEIATLIEKPLPPLSELLEAARGGRGELKMARLELEAQGYAVRGARSSYFPQLSGFGLVQLGNNPSLPAVGSNVAPDTLNPFSNLSLNITLGASLSLNVFNMMNTYTSVKSATYEELRLTEEERRVFRLVDSEVRVAYAKVQQLVARRAPVAEAKLVAADNLKILEARYTQGTALVIELLDSQVELAGAELNLSDAEAQLMVAWLELKAAMGVTVGE